MGAVFDHKAWTGKSGGTYGSLAVGDITQLNVDGVATDFIVVHQGNPDGSLYDESCEGTWLLMKESYIQKRWDDYGGKSYEGSNAHSYLNASMLSLLDADVQSAVKQVKIPYRPGYDKTSPEIASGSNGLSAKLFLLSGYEVGFSSSDSSYFPQDGAKLDFFSAGTASSANALRVTPTPTTWWLRSPIIGNYSGFVWAVDGSSGSYYFGSSSVSTTWYWIRPCLIMPVNQKIFS